MTNLPENWIKCALGDIIRIRNGYAFPKNVFINKENAGETAVPLIKQTQLSGDTIDLSDCVYVDNKYLREKEEFIVSYGDILIGLSGSIMKWCVYDKHLPALQNQRTGCIKKSNKDKNVKYILFYLRHISNDIIKQSQGMGILNISTSTIEKNTFPLPPLAEQGRIVAKIEELFAGIDAGVENLKSVKNQIALYRQSVLKSAFDGTLYKTTEWNIDVLKNLCSVISDGDHQPPPKAKNGIPFIMISNINKNLINFEDTNFVSENYYTSLSEKRKPKWGDVLYSVVGSYGIPVLIDFQKEFCFQRHIALLRPNTNKIFSKFLFYMLRSRNVYNQATDCSTGTAQKTVPLSGLREIHIPVPTFAEQERIVAEIESRFERADALETAVDRALNDAEKLKQAVLKKAFRGELVPQNPDDEPASVLLDRIRAARASELPAKKGKRK